MTADRLRLTQETITIVTVGLTLLGTILYTSGQLTERVDTLQAEIRANREYFTEQLNANREYFTEQLNSDRARFTEQLNADRARFTEQINASREYFTEQLNADRETFTREILRLTAGQARLAAIVEPIDTP